MDAYLCLSKKKYPLDCINCSNTNCLIKKHSNNSELEEFLAEKHRFKVAKGQSFIIEGAPVHGLFFVYKGKVKMVKTGINGREQIVRLVNNGEVVGHRSFGVGEYYQIGAVAIEDSILCSFTKKMLRDTLQTNAKLTYDFMTFYSEELNRSETKVRKFAQMTVRERIIDAILYIHRKFKQSKGWLTLELSRRELADFAGTTEEQSIRMLSALKSEGLIKVDGRKIGILDLKKLRSEISEHNYYLDS